MRERGLASWGCFVGLIILINGERREDWGLLMDAGMIFRMFGVEGC